MSRQCEVGELLVDRGLEVGARVRVVQGSGEFELKKRLDVVGQRGVIEALKRPRASNGLAALWRIRLQEDGSLVSLLDCNLEVRHAHLAPAATKPCSVLFLDIDGVLNNVTSPAADVGGVESQLLRRLIVVIKESGCHVVLSSSWRTDAKWLARFSTTLSRAGAPQGTLLGITPAGPELTTRVHEIRAWLAANSNVTSWAVVDDMDVRSMCDGFAADHVVVTDGQQGLRAADARALLALLRT